MAPARLSADVDAEPPGLSLSPLDQIVRDGLNVGGKRVRRVTVDFDTGEVSFAFDVAVPVTPPARLTPLAEDILDVLRDNGGWMFGADIAFKIDQDQTHTDGAFREAIRVLRKAELIESSNTNGYRLKS